MVLSIVQSADVMTVKTINHPYVILTARQQEVLRLMARDGIVLADG